MLADQHVLATYFGQNFRGTALPSETQSIELISKHQTYQSLANSTKDCLPKGPYRKESHSFAILALIDPAKVRKSSAWADRFLTEMKLTMGC